MGSVTVTSRTADNMEERVSRLEEAIIDIRKELKDRAIADANIEKQMELMQGMLNMVQEDTSGLRNDMLKLIAENMEKTRQDMSMIIQMTTTNNQTNTKENTSFYQKVIFVCVATLITIVLAYFGLKGLVGMPDTISTSMIGGFTLWM